VVSIVVVVTVDPFEEHCQSTQHLSHEYEAATWTINGQKADCMTYGCGGGTERGDGC
jgi:hypothetical protein